MSVIMMLLLLLVGVEGMLAPLQPTVTDGSLNVTDYKRQWVDDFLGSQIDLTLWRVQTGIWKNAISDPQNVVVSDGILKLIGDYNLSSGNFTQGRIQSRKYVEEGFFEARVRPTGGNGWHPAFWLAPLNIYPPPFWNQELDIYEMNTYNPSYWTHTFHSWTNGTEYVRRTEDILFWRKNFNVWNMTQSFNVIGCEWTSRTMRIYYNGKLFVKQNIPTMIWSNPLQVLFTMALQPWDDPRFPFDFTALPVSFAVDYFAYYTFV